MVGIPKINSAPREPRTEPAPQAEVLGTIQTPDIAPSPSVAWEGPSGPIEVQEPPPPWETDDPRYAASDARQFVEVPKEWALRWLNPKIIEQSGWRYWQPVMASDPRVKVKVESMVTPEQNIRRGGAVGGDILGWMYQSWVESRRKLLSSAAAKLRESAIQRQELLKEEIKRGTYGPVSLTESKHPTHTKGEGRSMKD